MDKNIVIGEVDSDSEEELDPQVVDETMFKDMVIAWLKLDDKIKSLNEQAKDLKNEKKQFEDQIIAVMTHKNEETINFSTGKLKKNIIQSKGALKEDIIQEAINELTKDPERAFSMTQYIIKKRPISEKISLKRSNNNISKKKQIKG